MEVFCEIPCLTERSKLYSGLDLKKKWFKNADRRYLGESLQKFIAYNREVLSFLDVVPCVTGIDQNAAVAFRTSRFIGAVPLRAPDTGRQIGDFVVIPRFVSRDRFSDYVDILDILGTTIRPEILDTLPLASGRNFRPPLYLEAVRFLATLENLLQRHWIKFAALNSESTSPTSHVDWNKYIQRQFKIEKRLAFPIRRNILNEFHQEFSQLRFVFDICLKELLSSKTPEKLRASLRSRLQAVERKLYQHRAVPVDHFVARASDSPTVRACKSQANIILSHELKESTAWRVDFNDVFEKFIQHIFEGVARKGGGRLYTNPLFRSRSNEHYGWELRQIEPDAVYQYKELTAFIDAKYKSHLYNRYEQSDFLKSEHRHDLHQIMAYSSFAIGRKVCVLCYPSDRVEAKLTRYKDGVSGTSNRVLLVGVPLRKEVVPEAMQLLSVWLEGIVAERK